MRRYRPLADATETVNDRGLCHDKVGDSRKFRNAKDFSCHQRIELDSGGSGDTVALHLPFPDHVHHFDA